MPTRSPFDDAAVNSQPTDAALTISHSADDDSLAAISGSSDRLNALRAELRQRYLMSEPQVVDQLLTSLELDDRTLDIIHQDACNLVEQLRAHDKPTMMESFLSEYGLSTREGVGLMCLAEALLRVPDATTIDELIADKLESSDWAAHLGQSSSPLVNASTWALMLTGRVLDDGDHPTRSLSGLLKRVGEPVVRTAVGQAMKLLGRQFVLGQNIDQAVREARTLEKQGYTYSYDMLGEAAHTFDDADRYTRAYATAIERLSTVDGRTIRDKPGISVKLSALHPRYEYTHHKAVMSELLPRVTQLAIQAKTAGIGFNIDAEEADRLELSMDVIGALLADPALAGWDGLGVVVQAYSRRALPVINWLLAVAELNQRRIMVRLVKGAYWDTEIKQAQELGLASFPVFTRKINTDVSYLACAQVLLANRHLVYPQFATHNAHSVSAIRQMAGEDTQSYEFQRLHGMGESLHERVHREYKTRCRIYAPVGAHRDLLAYLVRRLLENGANSSFVNQIVDHRISPADVARCPVREVRRTSPIEHPGIVLPADLYQPQRSNSKGFRINDPASITPLLNDREAFRETRWQVAPLINGQPPMEAGEALYSPNDARDLVGHVAPATAEQVSQAIDAAVSFRNEWAETPVAIRAAALQNTADAFEAHTAEFCAMLCREAGKTLNDAISEVREAVDFLRYYAAVAPESAASAEGTEGHGVMACISPWNFPLAIFTGQIAGALVSGNVVIAKPAEQTPLLAGKAVTLMHQNGIPAGALQLLPGFGSTVGQQLTADPRIDGVCFTGSTDTSRLIERSLARRSPEQVAAGASPNPLLMAETGGLNAMIVDSSALTEQVVRDTVMSAFQSAGQRCSALRILYVQKEAYQRVLTMLQGAMDALSLGHPWQLSTDVGPVIDADAHTAFSDYIDQHRQAGSLLHQVEMPAELQADADCNRLIIAPALIKVDGIADMEREIFGPVLHLASFEARDLSKVVADINARGFGLTFGLHTRIDDRVQQVVDSIQAGNVYVNRNQIGAVVGSQPFGGEGLSGTGPKAGGPWYVPRLMNRRVASHTLPRTDAQDDSAGLVLPGPTGESNHWRVLPRKAVLLLETQAGAGHALTATIQALGCTVTTMPLSDALDSSGEALHARLQEDSVAVVLTDSQDPAVLLAIRQQLAASNGPLLPLVNSVDDSSRFLLERHICIDTTAAGGNASLLGSTT
ncbi:bifunctional proline dehydrogenase/L-glutamate gamma-semialdehyde dehydrogenase PutA [Granulosicoccus sp. 3-233]|uniref:bifunctional proline dehydrogenase/L-glutamate gamma-semialdehyde dehydrogenase PutA n=1 Tax=Granulosicoccus sp. 3-233 TaxID=3417969 RepID=UPI003D32A2D9